MRIQNWTRKTSAELWTEWRASFASLPQAEVEAIWLANRLVKDKDHSSKSAFYEVKDLFLRYAQPWLTEGQMVRVEKKECFACGGTGNDTSFMVEGEDDGFEEGMGAGSWEDLSCERCYGTGIWSMRTLYLHKFAIEGRRFSFHSYVAPARVSEIPGEDKAEYGGKFSEQELLDLPLPFSGLFRLLRYHAFAMGWGNEQPRPLAELRAETQVVISFTQEQDDLPF
jgi:hypothetical protein